MELSENLIRTRVTNIKLLTSYCHDDLRKFNFINRVPTWNSLSNHVVSADTISTFNKKLIERWDSERELFLRRHRTRNTKYNGLVHTIITAQWRYLPDRSKLERYSCDPPLTHHNSPRFAPNDIGRKKIFGKYFLPPKLGGPGT